MRNFHVGWMFLAASISVSMWPVEALALGPANTANDGPIVSGGLYFNTADGKTTFRNSAGSGLWLKNGSNLRGLEVNASGNLTNNGGTFHFDAPGQMVRLDGNIDVRGIRNQSGAYQGNGGNLFVDSAYLYQSGNIYANGVNGGLVQFNVGSANLTGNARIEAKGSGTGNGGIIAINASGVVDVQRQVVLDSTGGMAGTIDSNVINIEGGLVNVEGILQARGLVYRAENITPGGTIRLVSAGLSDLSQSQEALQKAVTGGTFSSTEASAIHTRLQALKSSSDGDIVIAGPTAQQSPAILTAMGGYGAAQHNAPSDPAERAGDGGTIILTAQRDIHNAGRILANGGSGTGHGPGDTPGELYKDGGNGGTVSLNAGRDIVNNGRIVSNGGDGGLSIDFSHGRQGGDGGLIAFSYRNQMRNAGVIQANGGAGAPVLGGLPNIDGSGGQGGLVVISGPANPLLNGYVLTHGGIPGGPSGVHGSLGSIVTPNPQTATNLLFGIWRRTETIEMLTHHENILLLASTLTSTDPNAPPLVMDDYLGNWVQSSRIRSVRDARGEMGGFDRGDALNEFAAKVVTMGITSNYLYRNFIFANGTTKRILFFHPDQLGQRFGEKISLEPFNTMTILSGGYLGFARSLGNIEPTQFGHGLGGGRFSLIANHFSQLFPLYMNGGLGGGSIQIAAAGNLDTSGRGTSQAQTLRTGGSFHGGSILLKAGRKLTIAGARSGLVQANGGVVGGNIQFVSNNELSNFSSLHANGGQSGGSIFLHAAQHLSNKAEPEANRQLQANGGAYGGFIQLKSPNFPAPSPDFAPISLQANGGIQNGQIVVGP